MDSVMFGQMFNEFVLRKGFYNGGPVYKMYVVPVAGVTLDRNDFINTLIECKEAIDRELNNIVRPKNNSNKVFGIFDANADKIVIDGDLEYFDNDDIDDEELEVLINDITKDIKVGLKNVIFDNAINHNMVKVPIVAFAEIIKNACVNRTKGTNYNNK